MSIAYFFAYSVVPALLLIGILYSLFRSSEGNKTQSEKGLSMDVRYFFRGSYGRYFFLSTLTVCIVSLLLTYFNVFPESMVLVLIAVFSLFLSIIGLCFCFEKGVSIFIEIISVGIMGYTAASLFVPSKKLEAGFGIIFYTPIFSPFALRFFDRILFRKTRSFYVYFSLNFVIMGLAWIFFMIGSIVIHNFF